MAKEPQDFVARTDADGLMINSPIFDRAARLHSYELTTVLAGTLNG